MASSSLHIVSPFHHLHQSPSSSRRIVSCAYSTSRRLALIQLGTVIPQTQLLGAGASTLLDYDISTVENTAKPITVENAIDWSTKDKRKMLHVVYRVGDLEKTIKFYTECLGMKVLRQRNIPEERYANAFVGYGPEETNFVIELTYNYGVDKYDIGTGFGHFGIAVEDVAKTVDLVKAKGGKVTKEPSQLQAFIEDPDGYTFELVEKKGRISEPLCQVMLRVGDIDRSINFYQKAYGMKLIRRKDEPEYKCTKAIMGYGSEDESPVLELTYNYGITEYDKGNGYGQIAIGTDDVYKTAQVVKLFGGDIVLQPGPLPVINTKITACLDPDGWKSVFVDNIDFMKELE
ncbi:hypothetical protein QVD17_05274 [Tagetes erecta]|uniref:Lactoylglutathione lyase n=1 Tax=Tagetes erecta TaxID=13708 RepID=A0AAD8PBC8_TARER|nr:hypothetical protein QVD17_05274 [Tagetes erecta]